MTITVKRPEWGLVLRLLDLLGFKPTRREWFLHKAYEVEHMGLSPQEVTWKGGWIQARQTTDEEATQISAALDAFVSGVTNPVAPDILHDDGFRVWLNSAASRETCSVISDFAKNGSFLMKADPRAGLVNLESVQK